MKNLPQSKKAASGKANDYPAFKKANDELAAAYWTQQDYLLTVNKKFAALEPFRD